jgi:hypothetical protein
VLSKHFNPPYISISGKDHRFAYSIFFLICLNGETCRHFSNGNRKKWTENLKPENLKVAIENNNKIVLRKT